MSITYTSRKGRAYHLCQGATKTGRSRYYFAREPKDTVLEEIPEGYEIRESVNGVVSLARVRPIELLEGEISIVQAALRTHLKARHYRVDVKSKQITIHEIVGPDLMELVTDLTNDLGVGTMPRSDMVLWIQEEERIHGQFAPVMRFILTDSEKRHFKAQRMCYRGTADHWLDVEFGRSIAELASILIPMLGTDEFFELF
ncbi:MAG: hypothetical protein J7M39_07075 [Anaerolineae bacterium]|nr:hypothetical protein [Anaerolineae bacterium]